MGREGGRKRHRGLEAARQEAVWSSQVSRCGWESRHLSCGEEQQGGRLAGGGRKGEKEEGLGRGVWGGGAS